MVLRTTSSLYCWWKLTSKKRCDIWIQFLPLQLRLFWWNINSDAAAGNDLRFKPSQPELLWMQKQTQTFKKNICSTDKSRITDNRLWCQTVILSAEVSLLSSFCRENSLISLCFYAKSCSAHQCKSHTEVCNRKELTALCFLWDPADSAVVESLTLPVSESKLQTEIRAFHGSKWATSPIQRKSEHSSAGSDSPTPPPPPGNNKKTSNVALQELWLVETPSTF